MLYATPKDKSRNERQKQRRERDRLETGNAKKIEASNFVYDVFFAIDNICFKKMFEFFPLYWMPEEAKRQYPGINGRYENNRIMIDKDFYKENGFNDNFVNLIFHEMAHAYCDCKGITDTNGEKHLYAFAMVCDECGGACDYADEKDGFTNAYLLPETMAKVRAMVKE